ncbi:MAG: DUF4260 domain-containing protein [Bacteroidota bacterium]
MKNLLRAEELTAFLLSIYFFALSDYAWWWYPALILSPDIGMLGYLVNARFGALTYNIFHHRGIAILLAFLGFTSGLPPLYLAGVILFGHASLDRMLGYGLKYPDSFKNTHLGEL